MTELQYRNVTREIEGDLETILANDERQKPIILESDFKTDILPLLQRPFSTTAYIKYLEYIKEPTMPLRVASNEPNPTILFEVPPLHVGTNTSWSLDGTTTSVSHLMDYVSAQRGRTLQDLEPIITEFLTEISITKDISKKVFLEIGLILARYDLTFLTEDDEPMYSLGDSVNKEESSDTLFMDEYED